MADKEYNCPVCGAGLVFANDPLTKKLKLIKCETNQYDKTLKENVGCDFEIYSKQKLLEPKLLLKDELKALAIGEKLRINNLNVFVDAQNPTIVKSKKGEKRFYLKIERDEDIIEKV